MGIGRTRPGQAIRGGQVDTVDTVPKGHSNPSGIAHNHLNPDVFARQLDRGKGNFMPSA